MIIFLVVVLTPMINQIIYLKQKNCLKSGCSYNLSCLQMYIVNVYTIEKYETNWKKDITASLVEWLNHSIDLSLLWLFTQIDCAMFATYCAELFLLIIIYFLWHLIVLLICIKSSFCSIKRFFKLSCGWNSAINSCSCLEWRLVVWLFWQKIVLGIHCLILNL